MSEGGARRRQRFRSNPFNGDDTAGDSPGGENADSLKQAPQRIERVGDGTEFRPESQIVLSLTQLNLDEETLLGAEKGTRLRLEDVRKRELSLRLLRDELAISLSKVKAETGEYIAALGEILTTVLTCHSSGVLPESIKRKDANVVRESLVMIENRLNHLGISDQDSKGVYGATEAKCLELSRRAKVGHLSGEGGARLVQRISLRESRWGSFYGLGLTVFIVGVFRFFLVNVLVDIVTLNFHWHGRIMELASLLVVITAIIYLVSYGAQTDNVRRQCNDTVGKFNELSNDLKKVEKFATLPKECFTTAAGIVEAVKRNLQAVLGVLNSKTLGGEDDGRWALVENQLLVFWEVVANQQIKLTSMLQALQKENLQEEEVAEAVSSSDRHSPQSFLPIMNSVGQAPGPQKQLGKQKIWMVSFYLRGISLSAKQCVVLVGDCKELGDWKPKNGVRLSLGEGGVWETDVSFPPGTLFVEYKYVVFRKGNRKQLLDHKWEGENNRRVHIYGRTIVYDNWTNRKEGRVWTEEDK